MARASLNKHVANVEAGAEPSAAAGPAASVEDADPPGAAFLIRIQCTHKLLGLRLTAMGCKAESKVAMHTGASHDACDVHQ